MTTIGKSPEDRLQIPGTAIRQQPVEPVAAYSGELSPRTLDEFNRRYGASDYVIIEAKGQDGMPVGRVYGWPDDAPNPPNQGLRQVPPGTPAVVKGPKGKVSFQGSIRAVHEFIKGDVLGEYVAPDKQRKAVLEKAGWSDANLLTIVDLKTGKASRLRALGIDGYRYQEVRWLNNHVLLEAEGNGKEVGLYTVDLRRQVPTLTLLDGQGAAADLRAAGVPLRAGEFAVTLTGYRWQGDTLTYDLKADLKDGTTASLQWQGRLVAAQNGEVNLVERRPAGGAKP